MHYNVCVLALSQAHIDYQYPFLSLLYISGALISSPMMGGDAGTKCKLGFCCRAGIHLLGSQRGQLPCERHVSMSAAHPPSTTFTTFPQGTGHCAAWLSVISDVNVSHICWSARQVHISINTFGFHGAAVLLSLPEARFEQRLDLFLTCP